MINMMMITRGCAGTFGCGACYGHTLASILGLLWPSGQPGNQHRHQFPCCNNNVHTSLSNVVCHDQIGMTCVTALPWIKLKIKLKPKSFDHHTTPPPPPPPPLHHHHHNHHWKECQALLKVLGLQVNTTHNCRRHTSRNP